MTPEESTLLIDKAGGNLKFAELIGLAAQKNFQQRIANWRRRGIPADVVLANLETIQRLSQKDAA